ncbi:MAG TPA: hypothetical protein VNN62_27190 [Methylomirabilota bacterium]|nr:hypothetical protein [Methylomirabilota bacterium]
MPIQDRAGAKLVGWSSPGRNSPGSDSYLYRRLSKDYKCLTTMSEAMIYVVLINIMIHRLARKQTS